MLFFYGVMVGVGGLSFMAYLTLASNFLYTDLDPTIANVLAGIVSAFIDNGTFMYAVLTMAPKISEGQWLLVTLTAGVGGSLLAIGSAASVGLLGQTKGVYSFVSHLKWVPVILLGYFGSIGMHSLINGRYFWPQSLSALAIPLVGMLPGGVGSAARISTASAQCFSWNARL